MQEFWKYIFSMIHSQHFIHITIPFKNTSSCLFSDCVSAPSFLSFAFPWRATIFQRIIQQTFGKKANISLKKSTHKWMRCEYSNPQPQVLFLTPSPRHWFSSIFDLWLSKYTSSRFNGPNPPPTTAESPSPRYPWHHQRANNTEGDGIVLGFRMMDGE